jgi:hypothetical protein
MTKLLAILDGFLNQLVPFIRYIVAQFKRTPIEKEKKIDEETLSEKDQAMKTGRPKWD